MCVEVGCGEGFGVRGRKKIVPRMNWRRGDACTRLRMRWPPVGSGGADGREARVLECHPHDGLGVIPLARDGAFAERYLGVAPVEGARLLGREANLDRRKAVFCRGLCKGAKTAWHNLVVHPPLEKRGDRAARGEAPKLVDEGALVPRDGLRKQDPGCRGKISHGSSQPRVVPSQKKRKFLELARALHHGGTMGDPNRIDSEKMSLHPRRVAEWLEGRDDWERAQRIYPLYVEVSPVGYCNHACTFCGVDYMLARPDKPMLAPEVMVRALQEMRAGGVRSVMFAGAGEPLLYKPLAATLKACDAVGLDASITTNAVLLSETFCEEALGLASLRWIKVSLNAGNRETYAAIHKTKPEDFDRVLANLERAVKQRARLGGTATLGAQMVAVPEATGRTRRSLLQESHPANVHTAMDLALRLRDIGLDYLVIKPYSQHQMSEWTRMYDGVRYGDEAAWIEALESVSTDSFKVIVRKQTMASLESDERGYTKCQATPFVWAYLEADGEVWGCSTYLGREEKGVKYGDDRFRYGNVNEASFDAIWRGERRRANWAYVRNELDVTTCRVNCRMHHVNRYLHEVAEPGPHVNFI